LAKTELRVAGSNYNVSVKPALSTKQPWVYGVERRVRVIEGYVYVYPYAGDDVFIHAERVDASNWDKLSRIHSEAWSSGRGLSLLDILEDLKGKKVRVVIEQRRITIEILEE